MKLKVKIWLILMVVGVAVAAWSLFYGGKNAPEMPETELAGFLEYTAGYLEDCYDELENADQGGDMLALAFMKSGLEVPEKLIDGYFELLARELPEKQTEEYADYSRAAISIAAAGKVHEDFCDFAEKLSDRDKVTAQGVEGAALALLAIDYAGLEVEEETIEFYLDYVLARQMFDGSFAEDGDEAEAWLTADVLTALSRYTARDKVKSAVESGLEALSSMQQESGAFIYDNKEHCLPTAKVIIALCSCGISIDDPRFVKNGSDAFMGMTDFVHQMGGFIPYEGAEMGYRSTELAFCAMAAMTNEGGLYA